MPQKQEEIPLVLKSGTTETAVATGNNASWHCHCNRSLPLLGKSGQISGPSDGTKVTSPDCGADYFVVPDGGDYKKAVRVDEL